MILAYRIFTTLLYPFLFIFVYYRKIFNKEDPIRYKEKILVSHFRVSKKKGSKLIWFHAASIGELKSIVPIINKINVNHKNLRFLITTTTLSSGNFAKIELKEIDNAEHRYFPLDVPFLIRKFLCQWKPDKIFLVDSEIWPNLILAAKNLDIPIALINARLTLKSFKRWIVFRDTAKYIFKIFSLCLCSNAESKNFLEKLGSRKVYYKGNIKLIEKIGKNDDFKDNRNYLSDKRFWVAASTHKNEEEFCLKTHMELKKKFKDLITVIAPRHIERSKKIKYISEKLKLNTQILNENENIQKNNEILIVNYFGALNKYFKHAKSVFIGKSLDKGLKNVSGQNPIEATKLQCKIYHGPYVYNFQDIYKILEDNNISTKIETPLELSKHLTKDLESSIKIIDKGKSLIDNLGEKTLSDTMVEINNFLNDKIK